MFNLVKKERAPRYILIVVVSFALSVMLIRGILHLTGYPKIGNGTLHIAHVLFGGVFLTIGACLTLIFSNAKTYYFSSVLIGVGMGFFFDEVGKFITENNDYFFQAAAPIIYIIFLLTFFVYLYLKKPRKLSQRELFYQVLDDMKEILDEDLDPIEKKEILDKLETISNGEGNREVQQFSRQLRKYISGIEEDTLPMVSIYSKYFQKLKAFIKRQRKMHVTMFWMILILLVARAVNSVVNLVYTWFFLLKIDRWYFYSIEKIVGDLIIHKPLEFNMLIVQTIAEGIVGLLILWAVWKRYHQKGGGLHLIRFALLFSILSIDIIAFYFEQFSHIFAIFVDVMLIVFLDFYGRIYDEDRL